MDEGVTWMQKALDWVVVNGVSFLVNLIVFFIILFIGSMIIRWVLRMTEKALHRSPKVSEILEKFVVTVLHKILWLILLMIALPKLGINMAPLIAGLGVGGFIIGFAFQESLGNLAAGLMLLINQPYAIGDYVEAGGVAGAVKDMNVMATILTTPDNKKVTVPNRKIWGAEITNYTALPNRRVDLLVGISYKAEIGKAVSVVERVLKNHELVLDDPAPTIGVKELADSSVNLVVRPWVKTADYWTVFFDVTRKVKEAFDAEGVGIPFPQMDVHIKETPKSLS